MELEQFKKHPPPKSTVSWLCYADGLWTAGYDRYDGKGMHSTFFFADTAKEAVKQLEEHLEAYLTAYSVFSRPGGGEE